MATETQDLESILDCSCPASGLALQLTCPSAHPPPLLSVVQVFSLAQLIHLAFLLVYASLATFSRSNCSKLSQSYQC